MLRLVAGDATGGVAPERLRADLDASGLTVADLRGFVVQIREVRAAAAAADAARAAVEDADAAARTARAEFDRVRSLIEPLRIDSERKAWACTDAQTARQSADAALAAARELDATLLAAGMPASLLPPLPPCVPSAPRRWRNVSQVEQGHPLENHRRCPPGHVCELPHEAVPMCPPWQLVPAGDPAQVDPLPAVRRFGDAPNVPVRTIHGGAIQGAVTA